MPKGYVRDVKLPGPPVGPPPPPPPITFDDPEDDDWFQRLPEDAKKEMRRRWSEEEARVAKRGLLVKTTRQRSIAQGAILFVCTETCLAIPSWGHSIAALFVGLAVGELWHRLSAGRITCALTAFVPFAVLRLVFADGESTVASAWFAMFGALILLSLAMIIGWGRERRRSDGEEY